MKKNNIKKIIGFLSIMLLIGFVGVNLVKVTFASNLEEVPSVTVTIDGNGKIFQVGDLTGEKLLFPSTKSDAEDGIGSIIGTIRINNQYKRINIDRLGVGLNRDNLSVENGFLYEDVYDSFLKNVKIKVEKGTLLAFNKTIIDYANIGQLLHSQGGFILEDKNSFNIDKGESVDLKYILQMHEESGNELQGVVANMPFYINTEENLIVDESIPASGGNTGGSTSLALDEIVEIDEEIPLDEPDLGKHWAHDCIIDLLDAHVIIGLPHASMTIEDYFNKSVDPIVFINEKVFPDKYITRAETAVLIGRALGLEDKDKLMTGYLDTIPDWARGYVISTTKQGIFKGYPFNLFKGNKHITREEMIAVLTRAFNISLKDTGLELNFRDKDKVSSWALESVKAGYERQVILGYPDNTYRPNDKISRGETFTILCKLLSLHSKE